LNETTRHANIVLPPRSPLERPHIDLLLCNFTVRNFVKWSEAVLPPSPDSLDDWTILAGIAAGLAGKRPGGAAISAGIRLAERMGAERVIDLLFRMGPYGSILPGKKGLTLAEIRKSPQGIDLGPLRPMRKERVFTPTGKVDIAPPAFAGEPARLERWLEAQRAGSLLLIGRRHMRSNNSWMHNLHSLVKGPDRSALFMHPEDARRLGLIDGTTVRVTSRVGSITAKLAVSKDVMPAVVCLPHGFGHSDARDTMKIAGALGGANANAITDDLFVEPLTGTAVLNGVPVIVAALEPRTTVAHAG
jgi:anaerobic selenocysteine-containing dehydrogenase